METSIFINFEEGQKSLSNYHNIFLKRFYEVELDQFKGSLQGAFSKQNWQELNRILQSLKGTSGFIGALKCKMYVEALLSSLSEGEVSEEKMLSVFNQLIEHLAKLSDFLREFFYVETNNEMAKEENNEILSDVDKDFKRVKIVKKIVPPISRIIENETFSNYDDDEVSTEEICQRWNCFIV
jgi:chemotaxis protein histidine kinase CheA